jgi:hypothetical protein
MYRIKPALEKELEAAMDSGGPLFEDDAGSVDVELVGDDSDGLVLVDVSLPGPIDLHIEGVLDANINSWEVRAADVGIDRRAPTDLEFDLPIAKLQQHTEVVALLHAVFEEVEKRPFEDLSTHALQLLYDSFLKPARQQEETIEALEDEFTHRGMEA